MKFKAPPPPKFKAPPPPPTKTPSGGYVEPEWSGKPDGIQYSLELIKGGTSFGSKRIADKSFYTLGRMPDCDIVLDHPSSSRLHAIIQYRSDGASFVYDNGSTHCTRLNKNVLKPKVHAPLRVGDVLRFGESTRLYLFQGPDDLRPPERNERAEPPPQRISHKSPTPSNEVALDLDWRDRLQRGQLTEKQTTAAEKILRKERTIENLRSEVEKIRAKESAGSLTEGQQTQLGRCEKRLGQLQGEVDQAEEVLEGSLAESHQARSKGGKKRVERSPWEEDGDDRDSDEDGFYDRTSADGGARRKKRRGGKGGGEEVESAASLRGKLDALLAERAEKSKALEELVRAYREEGSSAGSASRPEAGEDEDDPLDAYLREMKVKEKQKKIFALQEDLSRVQVQLDRATKLMQAADPSFALYAK
ncbi:kanadaptin [Chloropicon primus]|uniref:Kanadaptin n=2 Tax=Chloropicon primus TaxID=1764295 RepID=A0A5B8MJB0_9CHLO|nr:kanadaptin [Chloropicon primus]UPQ99385.1 kanadaptin [Chloropicon primus]|eukprot:QDZ20174.1 kanadaptin [Chloropicon primus]